MFTLSLTPVSKQQEFKRLLHLLQEHREQLEMQLWPLEEKG